MIKFINRDNFWKVGLKIAYYRKLRGYTQKQLAEKVGISTSYLGQIEAPNLVKSFSMELLFDLANALEIPAFKLIRFDED